MLLDFTQMAWISQSLVSDCHAEKCHPAGRSTKVSKHGKDVSATVAVVD